MFKLLCLIPTLLAVFVTHQEPETLRQSIERHNPRPEWMTNAQYAELLDGLVAFERRPLPKYEHGGPEPNWNDPTIDDPCGGGVGGEEHEIRIAGTATKLGGVVRIDPPYYVTDPGTPYSFPNAVFYANDPAYTPSCGLVGSYAESGTVGENMTWNHRVVNGDLDAHPNATGFVFWSAGWLPAYWSQWGWTMLDPAQVYDIWVLEDGSPGFFDLRLYGGSGQWLGIRRYYDNPTDPAVVGLTVWAQGAWSFDGTFNPNDLTGSLKLADCWSIHFVPAH